MYLKASSFIYHKNKAEVDFICENHRALIVGATSPDDAPAGTGWITTTTSDAVFASEVWQWLNLGCLEDETCPQNLTRDN